MIKQTTSIFTLAAFLLLFGGVAVGRAQTNSGDPSLKIGYVNPQAILQSMPKFSAVKTRLQNYYTSQQKTLRKQAQALQKEISSYQQRKSVMTKNAKQAEQKKLGTMRASLQQAEQQANQEYKQKQQTLMQPLRKKIQQGIQSVAQQMNLSYVISAGTLLYVSPSAKKKYNITGKVKKAIGIGS